ncbi:MAG: S8 family serine peptidase, partial [Helicobacter sp.]|nr:S8 family serine peptidase [Helicobacter sp.]
VAVFAVGNSGVGSPGLMATIPSFDESYRGIIGGGALDAAHITRDENGQLVIKAKGISDFSEHFYKAENYSLMSFGHYMNGASTLNDKTQKDKDEPGNAENYARIRGTSQATAVTTGVAALVAEKFPFLNGKQIGDILLSTANKDFKAPKVVIKMHHLSDSQEWFSFTYIDHEVPKKSDGTNAVDEEQVKKDLKEEGYTEQEISKAFGALITSKITEGYEAYRTLSRESVFGQGVLDAAKALGGLSILDANRLNSEDIQKIDNNAHEFYYTLDLGEHNAEFSNDITQKKWDSNLHLPDAENLPTYSVSQEVKTAESINNMNDLKDLNIGFIKKGVGELVFSGSNSYEGLTVVQEGALRLKRIGNKGGELTASNVLVKEKSILSGNGIIYKDLNNQGTVRPGNKDLTNLEVKGTYRQSGEQSSLQLDFGKNKNSQLIASSYEISEGSLEYIPLSEFFASGDSTRIELGELGKYLENFSEVKVKENNVMTFEAKLDSDKVSINKPVFIDVSNKLKPDAYSIVNGVIGDTLMAIRQSDDLPETYKEYFGFLDNTENFKTAIESMEAKNVVGNTTQSISSSQQNAQHGMLFAINPVNLGSTSLSFDMRQSAKTVAAADNDIQQTWNALDITDNS